MRLTLLCSVLLGGAALSFRSYQMAELPKIPAPPPESDPRIKTLYAFTKYVRGKEEDIDLASNELLRGTEELIHQMSFVRDAIDSQTLTLQHFHKLSSQLRADADQLLKYFDRLESTTAILQLDEKTAADILRDAAEAFREYANQEQYVDISGDYMAASQWFDNLADSIAEDSTWYRTEDLSELKSSIE